MLILTLFFGGYFSLQTATLESAGGISLMAKLLGQCDSYGMRGRLSKSLTTSAIFVKKKKKGSCQWWGYGKRTPC